MLRSTLFILLVAFSASGYGQGVDYTYVQASYGQMELDLGIADVDGDGFGISGSAAVSENFHVFGDYQMAGLDFGVDLDILELGFGYNTAISETMDFVARAAYVRLEADAPGVPSDAADGYGIGIGVRGMVADDVELHGGLDYIDVDSSGGSSDSETRFRAGFMYGFSENFSAGLDGSWWDDVSILRITARFSF